MSHRILILAPHTDDGEFGCGGSIARFLDEGAEVYYAAFSTCEESLPDDWPKDTLVKEVRAATQTLGVPAENLIIHKFPVRRFLEHRQDILEELVRLQRELQPTRVFQPTTSDLHQDHAVIAREGCRAFKRSTILAYEIPWNNIQFSSQAYIRLEPSHVQRKVDALKAYVSQAQRAYANEAFIRSMCLTRGVCIGAEFAEAFEVVRWVM